MRGCSVVYVSIAYLLTGLSFFFSLEFTVYVVGNRVGKNSADWDGMCVTTTDYLCGVVWCGRGSHLFHMSHISHVCIYIYIYIYIARLHLLLTSFIASLKPDCRRGFG